VKTTHLQINIEILLLNYLFGAFCVVTSIFFISASLLVMSSGKSGMYMSTPLYAVVMPVFMCEMIEYKNFGKCLTEG